MTIPKDDIALRDSIAKEQYLWLIRLNVERVATSKEIAEAGGINKIIEANRKVLAKEAFDIADVFMNEKYERDQRLTRGRDFINNGK